MTSTPLLPPDPDKPGWWWLRTKDARIFGAQWSPAAGCWTFGSERTGRSPSSLARYGYTLATRHRIPTPAELEAVWDTLVKIERGAAFAVIVAQDGNAKDCDEQKVRAHAFGHAAAMLRAALETAVREAINADPL